MLWRGIAQYANEMGLRYLVGCSSLNSKDPAEGWQMYRELERYRVSPEFETVPTAAYVCPTEQAAANAQQVAAEEDVAVAKKVPKAAEDISDDRCAYLRTAGMGPRVWHH